MHLESILLAASIYPAPFSSWSRSKFKDATSNLSEISWIPVFMVSSSIHKNPPTTKVRIWAPFDIFSTLSLPKKVHFSTSVLYKSLIKWRKMGCKLNYEQWLIFYFKRHIWKMGQKVCKCSTNFDPRFIFPMGSFQLSNVYR